MNGERFAAIMKKTLFDYLTVLGIMAIVWAVLMIWHSVSGFSVITFSIMGQFFNLTQVKTILAGFATTLCATAGIFFLVMGCMTLSDIRLMNQMGTTKRTTILYELIMALVLTSGTAIIAGFVGGRPQWIHLILLAFMLSFSLGYLLSSVTTVLRPFAATITDIAIVVLIADTGFFGLGMIDMPMWLNMLIKVVIMIAAATLIHMSRYSMIKGETA